MALAPNQVDQLHADSFRERVFFNQEKRPNSPPEKAVGSGSVANNEDSDDSQQNDVSTAVAYGDLEKLQRLVVCEGCSVLSEPDRRGYYPLQWAGLNNRTAAAQYIIEVCQYI